MDPRYNVPGDVYFAYIQLRRWSEGARYYLQEFGAHQVQEALGKYLLIITHWVALD